jgi:hypothetical protein
MIGFIVPVRDKQGTKNILDAITGLGTSTIANKFVRSSLFVDVIFKSVNKRFIGFDTVHVRNQRRPLSTAGVSLKIVSVATASL